MSDDGQGSATSTNADVMGEVLQGSDVANTEAAARQYSVGDSSMIAQAGDAAQLPEKDGTSLSGSQNTSFSDQADLETPNVKTEQLDTKESPQKATYNSTPADSSQGNAKQDLNDKLDDAAPGGVSDQGQQPEASTVATPAGKDASSVDLSSDTPSSQTPNGTLTPPDQASDAEAVSVKELIQQRSSSTANGPTTQQSATAPVRRRTDDDLPDGIKALKNRFSSTSPTSSSPSPQPIPLPKDASSKAPALVHLEVEHKPGTKFWPYKELKDLRIDNGIDPTCKEEYLTEDDFSEVFKKWDLSKAQFKAQPVWRQRIQKQTVGLF